MRHNGHYLRGNKSTEGPGNLIFFDTESYITPCPIMKNKKTMKLRLWYASRIRMEGGRVSRHQVGDGDDADSFWNFVFRNCGRHRTTWMFAHNLAFDLTQLDFWKWLDAGTFTIKPMWRARLGPDGKRTAAWTGRLCLDGRPTYIVCRRKRDTFKMVDTGNYWPTKLQQIGEDFGIQKEPLPSQDADRQTWLRRCKIDVEIIQRAITGLIAAWREEDCGVFQMTGPSASLQNFRHICDVRTPDGKDVDIVCKPNAKEHELEREAYYGGRIQPFFVGTKKGKFYHVDCNSLYPYVMREHLFPRKFVSFKENWTHEQVSNASRCYGVCARVLISSRNETFPVRIDGRQYHCTGHYWTSLTGPELLRAIDSGCVVKMGTVQLYSCARLFKKWVEHWYAKKVHSGKFGTNRRGDNEFAKLILNSLSGKWAQKGRYWEEMPNAIPKQRWGGWPEWNEVAGRWERVRAIAGNQQILSQAGEPKHAFPLISAFITSFGREYMRDVAKLLPPKSVFYMATDAFIVDESGYQALGDNGLLSSTDLGKFRLLATCSEITINGPNWYKLDEKETVSGIYGASITNDEGKRIAEMWETLPSIVAVGPKNEVTVTITEPASMHPDIKGCIDADGWWTPYRVTMDPDFSDRPSRFGWAVDGWLDTAALRIRPAAATVESHAHAL